MQIPYRFKHYVLFNNFFSKYVCFQWYSYAMFVQGSKFCILDHICIISYKIVQF